MHTNRKWIGLTEHLQQYEEAHRQLDIGKAKLCNFLHSYRDKCAHIKIGGRDERGLVGMGSKDGEIVAKFLPLLNKIVIDLLNKKHGDRVLLQPTELTRQPVPHEFLPSAGAG